MAFYYSAFQAAVLMMFGALALAFLPEVRRWFRHRRRRRQRRCTPTTIRCAAPPADSPNG